MLVADIQWQGILGADFLYAHGFCIDFSTWQLTSTTTTVPFYFPNVSVQQPGCDSVFCTLPQPSNLERLVPDSSDYSCEQVAVVRDLIRRNSSAFAWDAEPLGRTNILQHTIDTGSARPFHQPPRGVPVHFLEAVRGDH
ncbi:unnamed protein product [Dibothriocephalus latus]|uniref:Uncharacterized protein n=1 Tax=Dibothriocephalus latus TaxID=60516 RepID=A0A3P7NRY2_DIBLA|nr:unnamed protein product [Dibothriocephalus latus]